MPRRIEETVAANRSGRKRLEGYAIEVSSDATRDYVFTGNIIEVLVGLEVYTRPLGDSLIMGHPDPASGVGRGGMGDNRGSWSLVTDTESSGEFTAGGRGTVIDALAGNVNGLAALAVGSGTGAAATGDTALESKAGSVFAWGLKDSVNVTRATGQFRFHEYGETVAEFGVEDRDGDLMARLTTTAVDPTNDQELKVAVTFEFQGSGVGTAVVTSAGEQAVADSIQFASETAGLFEVAMGTGTATPSKSDTTLAAEEDRKRAAREPGNETVRSFSKWYKSEPSTQPINVTELGLFDNNGNLVWRTVFDAFEKNSAFPFRGGAQFRVI